MKYCFDIEKFNSFFMMKSKLETYNAMNYQDYRAKLSDFGLAKDGPEGDDTHVSTRVMGTHGYAAPEYIMTGKFLHYQCILTCCNMLYVSFIVLPLITNT